MAAILSFCLFFKVLFFTVCFHSSYLSNASSTCASTKSLTFRQVMFIFLTASSVCSYCSSDISMCSRALSLFVGSGPWRCGKAQSSSSCCYSLDGIAIVKVVQCSTVLAAWILSWCASMKRSQIGKPKPMHHFLERFFKRRTSTNGLTLRCFEWIWRKGLSVVSWS